MRPQPLVLRRVDAEAYWAIAGALRAITVVILILHNGSAGRDEVELIFAQLYFSNTSVAQVAYGWVRGIALLIQVVLTLMSLANSCVLVRETHFQSSFRIFRVMGI